jgi:apolipoprotein N-acyltransferase
VYFFGTLYWIPGVMAVYGGLQTWVAVLVNALLVAYLALFPALFAVVMRRLLIVYGARALIAAPLVWVATELGRTHVFGGFPWVLLGYSQATTLPVAQLASILGVRRVRPRRQRERRRGNSVATRSIADRVRFVIRRCSP